MTFMTNFRKFSYFKCHEKKKITTFEIVQAQMDLYIGFKLPSLTQIFPNYFWKRVGNRPYALL